MRGGETVKDEFTFVSGGVNVEIQKFENALERLTFTWTQAGRIVNFTLDTEQLVGGPWEIFMLTEEPMKITKPILHNALQDLFKRVIEAGSWIDVTYKNRLYQKIDVMTID